MTFLSDHGASNTVSLFIFELPTSSGIVIQLAELFLILMPPLISLTLKREKLFSSLDEMNRVKIAGIAGTQRKRFIQCLFEELNVDDIGQTIFFDDSIFSGYTFLAAQYRLKNLPHDNIVLFDKTV